LKVLLVLQLDEHHHHVSRHYSFKIARHMEHLSIDWNNLASIIHLFIHLKHAILMAFVKIHLLKSSILNIQNISIEAPMNYNGNSYTFKIKKKESFEFKTCSIPNHEWIWFYKFTTSFMSLRCTTWLYFVNYNKELVHLKPRTPWKLRKIQKSLTILMYIHKNMCSQIRCSHYHKSISLVISTYNHIYSHILIMKLTTIPKMVVIKYKIWLHDYIRTIVTSYPSHQNHVLA
jgi:hypothetical protein